MYSFIHEFCCSGDLRNGKVARKECRNEKKKFFKIEGINHILVSRQNDKVRGKT